MERIPFKTFALIGIFPFVLNKQQNNEAMNCIKISKPFHVWSMIFLPVVGFAAIWRSYFYFSWPFDSTTGVMFNILIKLEPNLAFFRVILTCFIVLRGKSIKRLGSFARLLLEISSKNRQNSQMRVFVTGSIALFIFIIFVLRYGYLEGGVLRRTDILISLVQDVLQSMVLIQLCLFFCIILSSLATIEQGLRREQNCYLILDKFVKTLSAYSKLDKLYQPLISMIILEIFYGVILGLRCAEDFLVYQLTDSNYIESDRILIIWYFSHVPFLFALIHLGHVYQRKVFLLHAEFIFRVQILWISDL